MRKLRAMAPPKKPATYEDLIALPENVVGEIIQGELIVSPRPAFAHGSVARFDVPGVPILMGAYHPSRQNTNTGKLTADMLEDVFKSARRLLAREAG